MTVVVVQAIGRTGITIANGVTQYFPRAGYRSSNTTETNVQTPVQSLRVLYSLQVCVDSNSLDGTITTTSRKNTADGNLTVAIAAGLTGLFSDLSTHVDVTQSGDNYNFKLVSTGTTGTATLQVNYLRYCPTAGASVDLVAGSGTNITVSTASTTWFVCPNGAAYAETTTEANVQAYVNTAATWKNAQIRVSTNARGTASTVVSRIGSVNGTMSISITASTTGVFTDLSHTDALVAGNLFNWAVTTGTGAGQLIFNIITSDLAYSGSAYDYLYGNVSGGNALSFNANPRWIHPFSGCVSTTAAATEPTTNRTKLGAPATVGKIGFNVSANSLATNGTMTLYKNGAAGSAVDTITAAATGWLVGSTTDTWNPYDRMSLVLTGGTSGSITVLGTTMTLTDTSAAATMQM